MKQWKKQFEGILYRLCDRHFLKTVIYIFVISIFLGSIALFSVYRISIRNIEESSLGLCQAKVKEVSNLLDINIRQADSVAISLCQDEDVFLLGNSLYMDEAEYIKKVLGLRDRLTNYMHMNEILYSTYIYFKDTKRVISDAVYTADNYYDTRFISDDKVSIMGLTITRDEKTMGFLMSGPPDFTSVFKIVRKHFIGTKPIYTVVNIRTDDISGLINKMMLNQDGYFHILDKSGGHLLSSEGAPDYSGDPAGRRAFIRMENGKRFIVVEEVSGYTGWKLVFSVPLENIHSGYRMTSIYLKAIFLIIVILGLLLGVGAALRIQKPLNTLYETIRVKLGGSRHSSIRVIDRMKYLDNVYESLFDDNRKLSETVEKNMPLLRERFLMQILLDRNQPDKSIIENMNLLAISLPYSLFTVAAFEIEVKLDNTDEFDYLKVDMFREYIEKKLERICRHYTMQFVPNKIAVILNYESGNPDKGTIFHVFSEAAGELEERLKTKVSIGVSLEGTALGSLSTLFMEALKSLEYKFIFGQNEIIYFDHIDYITAVSPTYPFDLEQRLTGAIKACDRDEIRNSLEQIRKYIQIIPQDNIFIYRQLFLYMISNIKRIFLDIIGSANIGNLEDFLKHKSEWKIQSIPEYISYIEEISLKVAEYIELRRNNKNTEIIEAVIRYINENYSRNITVEDIAYAVYISVPYLYKLMKEEKDTSPANYLNQVRLSKAAEMLEDLHRHIKDVSMKCGFESIQTFNRQFKKYKNCSPSEYRERFSNSMSEAWH